MDKDKCIDVPPKCNICFACRMVGSGRSSHLLVNHRDICSTEGQLGPHFYSHSFPCPRDSITTRSGKMELKFIWIFMAEQFEKYCHIRLVKEHFVSTLYYSCLKMPKNSQTFCYRIGTLPYSYSVRSDNITVMNGTTVYSTFWGIEVQRTARSYRNYSQGWAPRSFP